jgi:hypothetical protein
MHRAESPSLFDEVAASCRRADFTPNIRHHQTLKTGTGSLGKVAAIVDRELVGRA